MQTVFKFATTAVLAALVAGASAPAAAQERFGGRGAYAGGYAGGGYSNGYRGGDYGRGRGHVDVGAVLLGAGIIAGIAAIASSHHDRDTYRGGYTSNGYASGYAGQYGQQGYYGQQGGYAQQGYGAQGYDNGQAAINLCSQAAAQNAGGRGGDARVSQITGVDGFAGGARVSGLIDVRSGDYDGYGGGYGDTQRLRFTCTTLYGRITDLRMG